MSEAKERTTDSPGWVTTVLGGIERVGNRLPHPVLLFLILSVVLAVASLVMAAMGLSATLPGDDESVDVRSLISAEGMRFALTDAVENFVTFPPLGTIVAVMLGIAVADRSGLLPTLLRVTVLKAPRSMVTLALMLAGVSGSIASDAAYIVLIPLGAMVFHSLGRNPLVGAVAAYVAVGAGYDASIFVTATDALLPGITTDAAAIIDPSVEVNALSNYWFSAVSAIVVAVVGAVVVDKVVTPRAGTYEGPPGEELEKISGDQIRGLKAAGWTTLVFLVVCAIAWLPPGSPWRDADTGELVPSPFIEGIAVVLLVGFTAAGYAYGRVTGSIRRAADVPGLMRGGMEDIGNILVLFFVIAQFLAYFKWTGIGQWIAVHGAEVLERLNAPTPILLLLSVFLVFGLGLVITSGSAQWTLLAPVLVPMLMLVGIDPESTQAAFRIGDSTANVLTPMSPYFAVALGFLQRYRKDAGIGTLMSMTLPIALSMLAVWTVLFLLWIVLGIPLGVG
ncbi:p-aminobenzoyl-glutamate transporter [Allosaccharopolyspora coralli]|uniref:p-aminobenzoyl-glutamate transporter n=1 Tax=Allosaccharopolyspora coralli TaxID=2665642 RepID=A0A5Q3Q6U7_9PSEU|nr:AbgT family transporter [Allosaccharopolyspora coralli]QGK69570.1 p-aminobenzoyl-glutamate transporter [Allosaccharopolyspora coralli]